jgi:cell division protein FtsL
MNEPVTAPYPNLSMEHSGRVLILESQISHMSMDRDYLTEQIMKTNATVAGKTAETGSLDVKIEELRRRAREFKSGQETPADIYDDPEFLKSRTHKDIISLIATRDECALDIMRLESRIERDEAAIDSLTDQIRTLRTELIVLKGSGINSGG